MTAVQYDANRAEAATNGRLWSAASGLPLLGTQLKAARSLTTTVRNLSSRSLTPAAAAIQSVEARPPFAQQTVDLAAVQSLSHDLDSAIEGLVTARAETARIPSRHLLGPLSGARSSLILEASQLQAKLVSLQQALRLAPAMLGAAGSRRYFIAVENPSESRGTGGLITGYAIVTASEGKLTVEESGTNLAFGSLTGGQGFPAIYTELAKGGAARTQAESTWAGVNIVPDWSSVSGRIAALWKKHSGETIDGVIGIEPAAIQRILAMTGPVTLPDGSVVNGQNAEFYMQVAQYAPYGSARAPRKRINADLASLALQKLVHTHLTLKGLRDMFRESLMTGGLSLASLHPLEEQQIVRTALGDDLPSTGAFLQVTSQNIAGGKMDAFIHRQVTVVRNPHAATGAPNETVSIALENASTPQTRLAKPQVLRLDDHTDAAPRGSTRTLLTVYADAGASFNSATVDGKSVKAVMGSDLGHPYAMFDVILDPQTTTDVQVLVHDRAGQLTYRVQPLAVPEVFRLTTG